MTSSFRFAGALVTALGLIALDGGTATAQSSQASVRLVVEAGRPLRVALEHRERVKHVGQPVTAMLLEPVYAYDRVVVPAGTKVRGHIEKIIGGSKKARLRSLLAGDLTPPRRVLLQFDALLLEDERVIPIETRVAAGLQQVVLRVAESSEPGLASRAREEAARRAKQAVAVVKSPGKTDRLKDFAIGSLPYRPMFLRKGTVYTAALLSPVDFGAATPIERAPPEAAPAPGSILAGRLITSLDSRTATRGTRIEAVLTQPVLSNDQKLILPQGAKLTGQVTLARPARSFHRNGQLRFLFDRVEVSDSASERFLASLYSVESEAGDKLTIDEEGGAKMTTSKVRFVAPALGALALVASLRGHLDYDTDGAGPETEYGGIGSSSVGGWVGLGALGVVCAQISRPVSLGITVAGVVRSTYSSVFGRGRDVSFPSDTSIQMQLAPGPGPGKE